MTHNNALLASISFKELVSRFIHVIRSCKSALRSGKEARESGVSCSCSQESSYSQCCDLSRAKSAGIHYRFFLLPCFFLSFFFDNIKFQTRQAMVSAASTYTANQKSVNTNNILLRTYMRNNYFSHFSNAPSTPVLRPEPAPKPPTKDYSSSSYGSSVPSRPTPLIGEFRYQIVHRKVTKSRIVDSPIMTHQGLAQFLQVE